MPMRLLRRADVVRSGCLGHYLATCRPAQSQSQKKVGAIFYKNFRPIRCQTSAQEQLNAAQYMINDRPREKLDFDNPKNCFFRHFC